MRGAGMGSMGLGLAVLITLLLGSRTGAAQTIYLKNNSDGIVRGASYDPTLLQLNWFNLANCLDDETVSFWVNISGPLSAITGFHLEAWRGAACEMAENRRSGACSRVGAVAFAVERMDLRVRDLVRAVTATDEEPCAGSDVLPSGTTLYFMLLNDDGEPPARAGQAGPGSGVTWFFRWPYQYDLVGPPAPTSVQASPGAGGLHVTWELLDAPADLFRYGFLCDPPPDVEPSSDLGPNEFCATPRLPLGQIPTRDLISTSLCGTIGGGATSGDITPVTPDVRYAVGVFALDGFYNFGPLSDTACDVAGPPPESGQSSTVVTDRGCAMGGHRRASAPLLMVAAIAALARRRRQAHRRTGSAAESSPER